MSAVLGLGRFSARARAAYGRQQEENQRKAEEEAAQHARDLETKARIAFAAAVSTTDYLVDKGVFRIATVEPVGEWRGGHVVGSLDDVTLRYDRRYEGSGYVRETVSVVLACERCREELLVVVGNIEGIGAAYSTPPMHDVCPRDRQTERTAAWVPVRRPMTENEEALVDSLVNVLSERGIVPRDDG